MNCTLPVPGVKVTPAELKEGSWTKLFGGATPLKLTVVVPVVAALKAARVANVTVTACAVITEAQHSTTAAVIEKHSLRNVDIYRFLS